VLSYVVQIGAASYWMGLLAQYIGLDLNRVRNADRNAAPAQAPIEGEEGAEGAEAAGGQVGVVPAAGNLDAQGQADAQARGEGQGQGLGLGLVRVAEVGLVGRLHRLYLEGVGVPTAPGVLMDVSALFMSFFLSIMPTWKPYA
jgi:hypothetical protein